MPESWRRTYMHEDLVNGSENGSSSSVQPELLQIEGGQEQDEVMQEQGGQEQGEGQHSSKKRHRGDTDDREIRRIAANLEQHFKDLIAQGVDVEAANALSLIKATGGNTRLHHDPNSKNTTKGTKRTPQASSAQQKQIEELKEELEAERKMRMAHEAALKERLAQQELENKKRQELELKFQLLYSHLEDKGLAPPSLAMPSPTNEVNASSKASNDGTTHSV